MSNVIKIIYIDLERMDLRYNIHYILIRKLKLTYFSDFTEEWKCREERQRDTEREIDRKSICAKINIYIYIYTLSIFVCLFIHI